MHLGLRLAGTTFLLTSLGPAAVSARAQQRAPAPAPSVSPSPKPSPTPSPAPSPSPSPRRARPIAASVPRQIEAVLKAHANPCERASREGVPCFPVSVETEGPRFSVKEAIRNYRPDGSPAPGPPTTAEVRAHLTGAPPPNQGGVSFDPVCTVKSLIRQIRGGTNTFYLYRTWNGPTERPLLSDHRLDPNTYLAVPGFRYEFLGEFKGECEAVAAWRSALRRAVAPPPVDDSSGEPQRTTPAQPADGSPPP